MEKSAAKHKILAIETSGRTFSVAAAEAGPEFALKGEIYFDVGLRHSDILKDSCVFLLAQCGWKKEDLTSVAVSTGPGSFTGLRVGVSFARAIAQARNLPLAGVSTFDVLARQARNVWPKSSVCVLMESIGREVFFARYAEGFARPQQGVDNVESLRRRTAKDSGVCLVGDGFLRYRSLWKADRKPLPPRLHFPMAGTVAELAATKIVAGKIGPNAWRKVVPEYLRPPLAVERLRKHN